jgi:hypothetical protein
MYCSFSFGYAAHVRDNLCHLEGHKVLFPSGQHFVAYDPLDAQVIPEEQRHALKQHLQARSSTLQQRIYNWTTVCRAFPDHVCSLLEPSVQLLAVWAGMVQPVRSNALAWEDACSKRQH